MLFKSIFSILIVGVLLIHIDAQSKEKIIDKSGKKPKWVKAEQTELLRVQVKSQTLFEAKRKAKELFKKSLNTAIVHHLGAKNDSLKKIRISNFINEYPWANVKGPAYSNIVGVHDTLLSSFYWEKYRLSKGGYLFHYRALYNCSNQEMEKIAKQFQSLDTKITTRLEPIKRKIDENNSIAWMFAAKDTLFSILEVAPPNYHGIIHSLIENIQKKFELVQLNIQQTEKTSIKFQVSINDVVIPIDAKPKVSSTCAKMKNVTYDNTSCTFEFDSRYCIEQDTESGFKVDLGSGNHFLRRSIRLF